jgi:hypothetical protein
VSLAKGLFYLRGDGYSASGICSRRVKRSS